LVRTKSIKDRIDPADGIRVLVTRIHPLYYPRKNYDLWFQELSPEPRDLRLYKAGKIDFDMLNRRVKKHVTTNVVAKHQLNTLRKLVSFEIPVTLLCYEKEGEPCHRYTIASMIVR
jgi:uncharacterized protein YeaO (DUF488 family)